MTYVYIWTIGRLDIAPVKDRVFVVAAWLLYVPLDITSYLHDPIHQSIHLCIYDIITDVDVLISPQVDPSGELRRGLFMLPIGGHHQRCHDPGGWAKGLFYIIYRAYPLSIEAGERSTSSGTM